MNRMLQLGLLAPTLILAGCGGGGGESAPAVQTSPVVAETSTASSADATANDGTSTEPAAAGPVTSTAELIVDDSFAFTSSFDLEVDIDLAQNDDAYLTICREYTDGAGGIDIDMGSCLLRAPLIDGRYQGQLALTNDVTELVVALWRYDGSAPSTWLWQRAGSNDLLSL